MKKSIFVATLLALALPAAAVPEVVTYAADIENDDGPFDGTVSVTFELFAAATTGTALWSETVASAVVLDGQLVHDLGSIEPLDADLLQGDALFLQVTLNGEALSPRSALRSVPFSLRARDADVADFATAAGTAQSATTAETAQTADNATRLDGQPASAFRFTAGSGLSLTANVFAIQTGGVGTAQLANGAVTTAKLGNGVVGTAQLAANSVGSAQLANNAVTSTQIADGSVGTSDLGSSAVKAGNIDTGAVNGTHIAANAVGATQIANGAVGSAQLANGSVGATQLAAGAISASSLADGAVSEDKLANNSVTSAKIVNGSITISDLSGSSTLVGIAAPGCGGNVQPVTTKTAGFAGECAGGFSFNGNRTCSTTFPCTCGTCKTTMCGINSNAPRFNRCDGTCIFLTEAQVCNATDFVDASAGRLVFE